MGDRFDQTDGEYAMRRRQIPLTFERKFPAHMRTERIIMDREAHAQGRGTIKLAAIPVYLTIGYVLDGELHEWTIHVDAACPQHLPNITESWVHHESTRPVLSGMAIALRHSGPHYELDVYPTDCSEETAISLRFIDVTHDPKQLE